MSNQKKILLNLDLDLYGPMEADAKAHSVSITEWIRRAIKARLDKPEPAEPDLFAAVQTPDKTAEEYWLEKIKTWVRMDGHRATAELLQSTGGVMPPGTLFGSAPALAKWLAENAKC